MARILPAQAFGLTRPQQQLFRRPRPPEAAAPQERTGLQDAADVMRLIYAGTGAAGNLFKLGSNIAEAFGDTPEERIAELQRQAIEKRGQWFEEDRPGDVVGAGSLVAEQQRADAARAPTTEQMLGGLVTGEPREPAPLPLYTQAAGPAVLTEPGGGAEQMAQRFVSGAPMTTMQAGLTEPEPPPADTPENRAVVQAAVGRLKDMGKEGDIPVLIDGLRRGGQPALDRVKAALGGETAFAELDPMQQAGARAIARRLERGAAPVEGPAPVTAHEWVERFRAGDIPSVSDLATSYGALMAQGNESDARALLRLARATSDYGTFIKSADEPQELVAARVREAIKKGERPKAAAPGGDVTLKDIQAIKGLRAGKKRRKGTGGDWKRRKKTTDEDIRISILRDIGITDFSEAGLRSTYNTEIARIADGTYDAKLGGDGKAAVLEKYSVDAGAQAALIAVGEEKRAAKALAEAQRKEGKREAAKATEEKKATRAARTKALSDVGIRASEAEKDPAAVKREIETEIGGLKVTRKAFLARLDTRTKNRLKRKPGGVAGHIDGQIEAQRKKRALYVKALNAIEGIEGDPVEFETPAALRAE